MKIGILECGHAIPQVTSRHGTFPDMFANLLAGQGFTFASYDVEHMTFPDSPQACDGWLLTGSKHGAYEDHAFIPPLEAFIRDAYAHAVPLVGICFGHQIIAQALGGTVEKFKDGWALGHTNYAFDGLGQLNLNAWHQDQVTTPPDGAKTLASNAFCDHAALIYDDRAYTIQPHPEFGGAIIADYAQLRKGLPGYPDALMDAALANATRPDDNTMIAAQIAEFFKQPRPAPHV